MKRFWLYISLAYISIMLVFWGLLYLIIPRLQAIGDWLLYIILGLYACFCLLLILDLLWVCLIAFGIKGVVLRSTLPLVIMRPFWLVVLSIGKLFSNGENYLWQGFISFSNALFRHRLKAMNRKKILMLLPHCLQLHTCGIKITGDIGMCKECGRCIIGDLKRISNSRGLSTFVATGGTLARKIVKDVKPDIIIASACEHDLGWGIFDIFPAPVYGILNERPEGPCKNTLLNIKEVERILDEITPQDKILKDNSIS
jgi:uncharacterized protein